MGEVFTYSGTHLTVIREDTSEFTQCAELGAVGSGRFTLDDTAGTLAIVGQKDFSATQSSCSVPLLFRGYIGERSYNRGEYGPKVSAGRAIEVQLQDINALLGFRLIDDTDGKRPSETVTARKTWLLASDYLAGLVIDNGRISASAEVMDAADYTNQYPTDVLADMVQAALGFNYHVNDYGAGPELVFRNDNTQTADSSTLRISNVLADASGVTLHPFMDAALARSPSQVYSKLAMSYSQGTVYEERPATATAFNGERGGVASNSNIKTAGAASEQGVAMLWQHSTEEDVLECTVLATDAQVNLMPPGWRIQAKFSHLNTEGYGSFTWFQILEITKKPIVADGGLYEVRLKLSPQEAGPPTCAYPATPDGTYYPLGGRHDGSNLPNPSDGVVYYYRPGFEYPSVPNPGLQGVWHFPNYGVGGVGTMDTMGSCVQNQLIFMTVGDGSWSITTVSDPSRKFNVFRGPPTNAFRDFLGRFNGGAVIEVDIDDTSVPNDCIRFVVIADVGSQANGETCGDPPLGWTSAVWVGA